MVRCQAPLGARAGSAGGGVHGRTGAYPQPGISTWISAPFGAAGGRDQTVTEAHSVTRSAQFVANLRSIVAPSKWTTWFSAVRLELSDHSLHVVAPSDFHLRWLQDHYREVLESLATDHLGPDVAVHYAVEEPPSSDPSPDAAPDTPPAARTEAMRPTSTTRFERKYVFDTYVVGQSNRLALAAAMAVAEKPGEYYNPLFLYGGAGLGKTHLLHAIGHPRSYPPTVGLRSVTRTPRTSSTNSWTASVASGWTHSKQRYRTIDLLPAGRRPVLPRQGTSPRRGLPHIQHPLRPAPADRPILRPPSQGPRYRGAGSGHASNGGSSPTSGHPMWRPGSPSSNATPSTRRLPYPRTCLEFIAHHVTDNIRELEGALTRVTAYAALTNQPITLDLAKDQLRDLIPATVGRPPTGPEILAVAAASYGFSVADLQGPSRRGPVVLARHTAMYLCRSLTDLSLPKIGKLFGGRDHSTVSHAIDKMGKLVKSDPDVATSVARLSRPTKLWAT